jgi:hypothetical protein
MGLRNNNAHYLQLIDTFAPCLVGKYLWNNDAAMERMCSSLQQHEFDNFFSVSDEAFVLLLIDNYALRWVAEATLQKQLVSQLSRLVSMFAVPHLLTNELWHGAPGCGNLDGGTGICIAGTLFIAGNMHCIALPFGRLTVMLDDKIHLLPTKRTT